MGGRLLSRCVLVLGVVLAGLMLTGCDFTPQGQVMAAYKRSEAAIAGFNAEKFREGMSDASYTHWWETLKLAREAKADQVKKLGASQMGDVLLLRNRATKEQLQEMNVDQYIVWLIDNGCMFTDKDYGIYPVDITVTGDTAQMQMGMEVEVEPRRSTYGRRSMGGAAVRQMLGGNKQLVPIEGYIVWFHKVNGKWHIDSVASARAYDSMRKLDADAEGKSVWQLMHEEEEADAGKIKPNIWDPPFRSR